MKLLPVADLIPHEPPILAIEELLEWSPGRATVRMTVADGWFVHGGRIDAVITLEYMAQAIAACLGQEAVLDGHVTRVGMVIACRSMTIERPSVAVGEELVLRVEQVAGAGYVSHFDAETRDGSGELVARATLTLLHGEKPPD